MISAAVRPLVVVVEWHALASLEVRWELALHDAADLLEPHGVVVQIVHGNVTPPGALLVSAYPAAAHNEEAVRNQMDVLRKRQIAHPDVRLAAVACGRSNEEVTEMNVLTLLCADQRMDRRHAFRALSTDELAGEASGWIRAIAHTQSVAGAGRSPNDYSPEAVIQEAGDPKTWLGSF